MAFGNVSTFYFPTAANAGASQWGSDVRKLLDSADAGSDGTTITNHGTGSGVVTRTCDPYTNNASDLTQADYGWAVTPTDMGATAAANRMIPAGDHIVTWRVDPSDALSSNPIIHVYVYKVGSAAASRARTLIATDSATIAVSLGAATTGTITVTCPEIIFGNDETIQYSLECEVAGVVITGRTVVHFTGTNGGAQIRVDHPGLRYNHIVSGDTVGKGTATRALAPALTLSSTGKGEVPTLGKSVIASKTFDLIGKGEVTRQFGIAEDFDLTGIGTPTYSRVTVAAKSFSLTGKGELTRVFGVGLSRTPVGKGVTDFTKAVIAAKSFTLIGKGVATESRSVQAFRSFDLAGKGEVSRQLAIVEDFDLIGRGEVSFTRVVVASKTFDLVGEGDLIREGLIIAFLERTVEGVGVVTEVHPVQAFRTFSLVGEGEILISGSNGSSITVPIDEIPSGDAPLITSRPIFIFDD